MKKGLKYEINTFIMHNLIIKHCRVEKYSARI